MTALLLDRDWVGAVRFRSAWGRSVGVDILVDRVTGRYRPNGPSDPLIQWVARRRSFRGEPFALSDRERARREIDFDRDMVFYDRPGLRRFYQQN